MVDNAGAWSGPQYLDFTNSSYAYRTSSYSGTISSGGAITLTYLTYADFQSGGGGGGPSSKCLRPPS